MVKSVVIFMARYAGSADAAVWRNACVIELPAIWSNCQSAAFGRNQMKGVEPRVTVLGTNQSHPRSSRNNAMKRFIQKHADQISGVLSGFDRLRFRGTIRLMAYTKGMQAFLNHSKVLLKDFKNYVLWVTDQIRQASVELARTTGREVIYLSSSRISKEERAREIAHCDGVREGLICVLSAVEPCFSYEVHRHSKHRLLELQGRPQKCLHYYFYLQHPEFGFMHLRLQTWFPLTIHIAINGREWLSRQMDAAGLVYSRADNCFTAVQDPKRVQTLFDQQLRTRWSHAFDRLLHQYHPMHSQLFSENPAANYYWSLEQSEWATDIMFHSADTLSQLYPQWLRYGAYNLSATDVMRFLGRKIPGHGRVHGAFQGEVVSDLERRADHLRVKHRQNKNWIKMYDKRQSVLRVETTVNDVRDFRVFRRAGGDLHSPCKWRTLRKSVVDIRRRAHVSQKANERYLDRLAQVTITQNLGDLTKKLCQPTDLNGKRVRALQPWSAQDEQLLSAVNRAEFVLNGFRNRDLRPLLYGSQEVSTAEQRRQSAKVSRQLRLLRAHGLIFKVPKTHRYQLTKQGQTILTALQIARQASPAKLAELAA
jgi:hypothetical protein